MLSTELSTFFLISSVLLLAFCVAIYWWVLKLARYCRDAVAFVQNQNKNAVSLRRIAELEAVATELLDSYNALLESHRKLRSRIGMRITRENRKENGLESETPPPDEAGRAGYKAKLREKLRKDGRL